MGRHHLQILARVRETRERIGQRGQRGAWRERKWMMGGDGTEWTGEMHLEKEGCERWPVLVVIGRGCRRCTGGAGMGIDGRGGRCWWRGCLGREIEREKANFCAHPIQVTISDMLSFQSGLCALHLLLIDRVSSCLHALVQENLGNWQLASAIDFANCCPLLVFLITQKFLLKPKTKYSFWRIYLTFITL
jgi:hypothetical protein